MSFRSHSPMHISLVVRIHKQHCFQLHIYPLLGGCFLFFDRLQVSEFWLSLTRCYLSSLFFLLKLTCAHAIKYSFMFEPSCSLSRLLVVLVLWFPFTHSRNHRLSYIGKHQIETGLKPHALHHLDLVNDDYRDTKCRNVASSQSIGQSILAVMQTDSQWLIQGTLCWSVTGLYSCQRYDGMLEYCRAPTHAFR